MWIGEDPSIAQACVKDSSMAAASAYRMTAACPELYFMAATLWALLRGTERRSDEGQCREQKRQATDPSDPQRASPEEALRLRGRWDASSSKSCAARVKLWRATPPSSR